MNKETTPATRVAPSEDEGHVHACYGCCSGAHPSQPHTCECGLTIPANASWKDYNARVVCYRRWDKELRQFVFEPLEEKTTPTELAP